MLNKKAERRKERNRFEINNHHIYRSTFLVNVLANDII